MQTLLDTNIQLDPHTRHARGLPVHYWFLAIKYTAVCLGCGREVACGVGEWLPVYVKLAPLLMMMSDMLKWVFGDISQRQMVLYPPLRGEHHRSHLHFMMCGHSYMQRCI